MVPGSTLTLSLLLGKACLLSEHPSFSAHEMEIRASTSQAHGAALRRTELKCWKHHRAVALQPSSGGAQSGEQRLLPVSASNTPCSLGQFPLWVQMTGLTKVITEGSAIPAFSPSCPQWPPSPHLLVTGLCSNWSLSVSVGSSLPTASLCPRDLLLLLD